MAVLAAVGSERLLSREVRGRYLLGWVVAAAAVALLASAGFFTGLGASIAGEERRAAIVANAPAVTLGGWRSFLFVAAAAALLYAGHLGKLRANTVGIALAIVVAFDLWSVLREYWRFSPRAAQLYASDATIDYVRRQSQPGRVLPLASSEGEVAYHDPFLRGDALMIYGVRNAAGYHGNHIARYELLDDSAHELSPRFWQLANVKYLLTNASNLGSQGLRLAVGPVRDAAGTTVYLYELPGENPLAWVTTVIVKAPDDQAFSTLYHPRFDVRTAALFDSSAPVTARADLQQVPQPLAIDVSVERFEPGRITLKLSEPAPAGSALVVSENYYPGWRAAAGGRPLPVGRVDLSLIGVELPEGVKEVDLRFTSESYVRGRMITVVALVASLALFGGGVMWDRRGATGG